MLVQLFEGGTSGIAGIEGSVAQQPAYLGGESLKEAALRQALSLYPFGQHSMGIL